MLTKLPMVEPSVVLELSVVGFDNVDQQIPLAVTGSPPFAVIFPPDTAEVPVIEVTGAVERVAVFMVVNEISLP